MNCLTRYISWQLLITTLSVITVLTCIIWLAQSLRFVDLVASKGVSVGLFLQMTAYVLPNLIVIVIPIAVLTAIVFIYNKLIMDHEFVVMQALGYTFWQLAKPGLLIGGFFTLVMYAFTLYIVPVSTQNFRDIEWTLKQNNNINFIQPGQFTTLGKYTVYLREKHANGDVRGILIYDNSKKDKPVTHTAEDGMVVDQGEKTRLVLFNGTSQERDTKSGKPNVLYFDQYTLETEGYQKTKVRKIRDHERFISELLFPPDDVVKDRVRAHMIAEGHQRLLSPFYSIVFALMALCSLVLGKYNRRGRVRQIVIAASGACVFYVVSLMLLNITTHLFLAVSLYYSLIALIIFLGLWSLSSWSIFSGPKKLETGT